MTATATTCMRWLTTTSRRAPDRVVEVPAILHSEVLGHRDLHAGDEVAVPDRLEHRIREAQVDDLLEAHLAEVVVDPQELRLVDVLVQLVRQRAGGRRVAAERLLHDDARIRRQPGIRQALDDPAEEERRDLEVEHGRGGVRRSPPRRARRSPRRRNRPARMRAAWRSDRRRSRRAPRPFRRSKCAHVRSSCSRVQSSTATPTIGQSSSPRRSSR